MSNPNYPAICTCHCVIHGDWCVIKMVLWRA